MRSEIDTDTPVKAIEASFAVLPEHETPLSHPLINLITSIREHLSPKESDAQPSAEVSLLFHVG